MNTPYYPKSVLKAEISELIEALKAVKDHAGINPNVKIQLERVIAKHEHKEGTR